MGTIKTIAKVLIVAGTIAAQVMSLLDEDKEKSRL